MKIAALAGGVGGAKLAHGMAQVLPPEDLTIIVNTGDDFEHLGLVICPDLDTVCYTLAGVANPNTGWGRADESWNTFTSLEEMGGPAWFRLGDRDLGLHLVRTHHLREGQSLSQVTEEFCHRLGISQHILPMSDNPISTWVLTDEGDLPFQEYFVHRRCQPHVTGFRFVGIEAAQPAPGVLEALTQAEAVVICPSNPWVSIDPILAIPGLRQAVQARLVVAVSPIIGGRTVKGPAAKMYAELGIEPSATTVCQHYRILLQGFVFDRQDELLVVQVRAMGVQPLVTDTLMRTAEDRKRLAMEIIRFIEQGLR